VSDDTSTTGDGQRPTWTVSTTVTALSGGWPVKQLPWAAITWPVPERSPLTTLPTLVNFPGQRRGPAGGGDPQDERAVPGG